MVIKENRYILFFIGQRKVKIWNNNGAIP